MRKFLMMAYTIISFICREIILTGLRPFKLPHEGLRPLDPAGKGPAGPKIPRRAIVITQMIIYPALMATMT